MQCMRVLRPARLLPGGPDRPDRPSRRPGLPGASPARRRRAGGASSRGRLCARPWRALGRREALGVVHLVEEIPARAGGEPLQIEENPRGHDRAGPASAGPHLVDAGDQANATSAVVGKEGKSLTELRLSTTPPKIRTPPKLVPPAGCELPLLDAQALRELGLVAPDLLDEALGVLSAHARLERVTEGKRRRQRVVDDGVPEARSTHWQLVGSLSGRPDGTRAAPATTLPPENASDLRPLPMLSSGLRGSMLRRSTDGADRSHAIVDP